MPTARPFKLTVNECIISIALVHISPLGLSSLTASEIN